jgi:hypothetical protein
VGCELVQPLWKTVWRLLKEVKIAMGWWLTPVILATQVVEIRVSWFKASLGK